MPCVLLRLEKEEDLLLDVPARVNGSCARLMRALCWSLGAREGVRLREVDLSNDSRSLLLFSWPALSRRAVIRQQQRGYGLYKGD